MHSKTDPDPSETAEQLGKLAARSQKIVQDFWQRQTEESGPSGFHLVDTETIGRAFFDLGAKLMADPARLAEAQMQLWQSNVALWQHGMQRMLGEEATPVAEPDRGDRRFKDQAWSEELLFDYLKQSYLISARWLRGLVKDVEGLDPDEQAKVEFYTRQFVSAMAPSNFALTNPAVLRKAADSVRESVEAPKAL